MKKRYSAVMALILAFVAVFSLYGCHKDTPAPRPTEDIVIPTGDPIDYTQYVDFVVNVDGDRDVSVLQLTDTQIIDSSQCRSADRIDAASKKKWGPDKFDEDYKDYVRTTVEKAKPDLIIITGDLVYGEFDDKGTSLLDLISFMDSFGIPWAPVFGNHDNECKMGVDWQCEQLQNAKHCLFLQRTLTGNGNYTVGIVQNNLLTRVFFMMDSNGCGNICKESLQNKHSTSAIGIRGDQIDWFKAAAGKIREQSAHTKISFAFHIQPAVFAEAFSKYGFKNGSTQSNPINIDKSKKKESTDFGYLGRDLKSAWDEDYTVFNAMKEAGADSIFVGHEHCNSGSIVYEGIRFQYGQKSSTYDRCNYVSKKGAISGGYLLTGTPIIGGTKIILEKNSGSIKDAFIIYASGSIS